MAKKIVFLLILNLSLIAAFLVGTAEETIEGVWTVRLRSCYLDYHIHAVALACPGVDYMWPLPVTQPWWDPTDTGPGWYARTPPSEAGFLLLSRSNPETGIKGIVDAGLGMVY